ncbi:MAG: thioredoxin domain-containing protein [Oscillatoriales cyanobacterium RM2_1_1]|nr:thioredoxin domain-containing protein [Oscillatoriales cyanobacterium SM2_3_0]NJO45363.1 thioredoxin domain-containing protein [Oscillatoriales cyanobacterium RM2_1_1]
MGLLYLTCIVLVSCSQPAPLSDPAKVSSEFEQQVLQVIRNNPEAILESVQAYQQTQQENLQQARGTFLEQMRTNPQSVIGNSPTQGSPDQKIVLVEFSDFQCPFCQRAHKTVQQFMAKHQGQVTLAYKHLPLSQIHAEALPAAKASWAAQQQGKFWEYQDALFTNQDKLGEDLYVKIAQDLKLDLEQFNRDRQSAAAGQAIEEDLKLANELGIQGTPFFVINGETLSGAVELSALEEALSRVAQKPSTTP